MSTLSYQIFTTTLTAAFEGVFSYKTVSFYLGTEVSTIELAIKDLTETEAAETEILVNRIIKEIGRSLGPVGGQMHLELHRQTMIVRILLKIFHKF
ncbi:hypothetical protein ACFFIX_14550 [Metabacillus herbersteinensis]|uniref:Uncharacterized protein n=1 Tax=Metabacillus herbersteinensis TaxID=283816 RepID=A0ABV6GGQ7_9BACI